MYVHVCMLYIHVCCMYMVCTTYMYVNFLIILMGPNIYNIIKKYVCIMCVCHVYFLYFIFVQHFTPSITCGTSSYMNVHPVRVVPEYTLHLLYVLPVLIL